MWTLLSERLLSRKSHIHKRKWPQYKVKSPSTLDVHTTEMNEWVNSDFTAGLRGSAQCQNMGLAKGKTLEDKRRHSRQYNHNEQTQRCQFFTKGINELVPEKTPLKYKEIHTAILTGLSEAWQVPAKSCLLLKLFLFSAHSHSHPSPRICKTVWHTLTLYLLF